MQFGEWGASLSQLDDTDDTAYEKSVSEKASSGGSGNDDVGVGDTSVDDSEQFQRYGFGALEDPVEAARSGVPPLAKEFGWSGSGGGDGDGSDLGTELDRYLGACSRLCGDLAQFPPCSERLLGRIVPALKRDFTLFSEVIASAGVKAAGVGSKAVDSERMVRCFFVSLYLSIDRSISIS